MYPFVNNVWSHFIKIILFIMAILWTKNILPCQFVDFSDKFRDYYNYSMVILS